MKQCLIRFSPSFLIVAIGFILSGYFLNLVIFTSIIIIHELGHYSICKIKKFKVKEIVIYPYGGITKTYNLINTDIDDELMLATFGIIFQSIYFLIILFLYKFNIIRDYSYDIFLVYHFNILFFNILPIYPLDGYKILNLLLEKLFSYKLSNNISLVISIICILCLIVINYYKLNYSYIIILIVLIINIYKLYKDRSYNFNKFLLERYIYNITYPKTIVINKKDNMHKNKSHIIHHNKVFIKEREFLMMLFKKK